MRNMNCRRVRREIEEVATGESMSSSATDHLKTCAECGMFRADRLKLREMLSSLGSVEAPGDFDFRLRARLANEKRGRQPFVMRTLSLGFRSVAVTAMLLLVGAGLLFVSLKTRPNSSLSANGVDPSPSAVEQHPQNAQPGVPTTGTVAAVREANPAGVVDGNKNSSEIVKPATIKQGGFRQEQVAWRRSDAGSSRRVQTQDLGSTGAKVLRADAIDASGSNVFPIGASYQSLKVSLDDGRGTSRTISLPSVSFGSQRVLAQDSSPLLASARSDW